MTIKKQRNAQPGRIGLAYPLQKSKNMEIQKREPRGPLVFI
ncbi:hypothetical protein HMPREF9176_0753 [Streptococcus downei F0415]|nr:hypothetical protein HMPREF9176_0753 [Streptococcus downei F0415]